MQAKNGIFVGPLLGAAIVMLIAALLARPLGPVVSERARSRFFVVAPAQIIDCRVLTEADLPVLRLAYQYWYKGHALKNDNWRVPPLFVQTSDYQALCERLSPGRAVDVYVDPRRPEIATLERGFSGQDILSLLLFLGCLGLASVFGWGSLTGKAPGHRRHALVTTAYEQVRIYNSSYVGGLALRLLVPEFWVLIAVLALGYGKEPSFRTIGIGLGCLAGVAAATYLGERRTFASGRKAIIIDRTGRAVTGAKALGQVRHTFSIDDLRGLAIVPVQWAREGERGVVYAVGAFARPQADEVVLIEQNLDLDRALDLAQLLAREVNRLRPDKPISAPTEPIDLPTQ